MRLQTDAAAITDRQIRQLRNLLFARRSDSVSLLGLVACNDALGCSHRRRAAREHCEKLLEEIYNSVKKEVP